MNKRIIATVLGAAALAVPAAAVADGGHGKGHGKRAGKEHVKGKKAKKVMFVFKGTFTAPGSIKVEAGNAHVRKGGYVGNAVDFDFAHAKIVVADTNADGERNVADVKDGDRVLVQARMLKRTKYVAPDDDATEAEAAGDNVTEGEPKGSEAIVARKLIDRTNPPVEDAEDEPTA